jgi:hypothetical protein
VFRKQHRCSPGSFCTTTHDQACGCETYDVFIHGPWPIDELRVDHPVPYGRELRYIIEGYVCEEHRGVYERPLDGR